MRLQRLHRIHAGFILGASLLRAFRRAVFALLLTAGCIWLVEKSFNERPATLLAGCVIIWWIRKVIRIVGELLGPPEPAVKSKTRLERRRALRRAGLLKWR
jgi:hypothetical protein